jgi:hypothetical protein
VNKSSLFFFQKISWAYLPRAALKVSFDSLASLIYRGIVLLIGNFLLQFGTKFNVSCFRKLANENIQKSSVMIAYSRRQVLSELWLLRRLSIGIW